MPDFQILKITIDPATRDEKVYFRAERVGSTTLGGNQNPPYPSARIVNYHAQQIARKRSDGHHPTPLDKAAAEAKKIEVEILRKEGLESITLKDATEIRNTIIAKFKEENHDWPERLLNINSGDVWSSAT